MQYYKHAKIIEIRNNLTSCHVKSKLRFTEAQKYG